MHATALIAEDEPLLARALAAELTRAWPGLELLPAVGDGASAVAQALALQPDVLFFDIRMPGMSGLEAASALAEDWPTGGKPFPQLVFVTAYDQYAVEAFELAAVDYLLKPVRAERLAMALAKLGSAHAPSDQALDALAPGERRHFSVSERGRILLLAIEDVLYLKAELKYVTARTLERDYLLDESLVQLEQEFPLRLLRLHRNCLVARAAVHGVERVGEPDAEGRWEVLLKGVDERLPVSRRQWPAVRQALRL